MKKESTMVRAKLVVFFLASALAASSCALGDAEGDLSAEREDDATSIPANLAGTYDGEARRAGDLTKLVFKTDGSYHAAQLVYCISAPCDPVEADGRFRLFSRAGNRYVELSQAQGIDVVRYQYTWRGTTLLLRRPDASEWQRLTPSSTAWCAAQADCSLQELPEGPCAGAWSCEASACKYDCRASWPSQ
jgi:hypothetical protein